MWAAGKDGAERGLEGTWGAGGCNQGTWGLNHPIQSLCLAFLVSSLGVELLLLSRATSRLLEQEMLSPTPRPPSLSLCLCYP